MLCLITNNWVYIYKLSGIIGVGSLVACGVTIGAFQSGLEAQSDAISQTKEGQDTRIKWSTKFLLFGLPHVVAASIYIYFVFINT